jgi:alpha-D-xyloside xylohydrolase
MVCPVTQPMYYAAGSESLEDVEKVRSVYLPAGSDWYDYWTGEFYLGGQTIIAPAPLNQIPLYARAGSIIPMGPDIQYSDEQPHAPLGLHIYPGQDGHFTLYEDEGDNYNYEQGAFTKIPIRWQEDHQRLVIDNRQGSYPGMINNRKFQITIISKKNNIDEKSFQLEILYAGQSLTIESKT